MNGLPPTSSLPYRGYVGVEPVAIAFHIFAILRVRPRARIRVRARLPARVLPRVALNARRYAPVIAFAAPTFCTCARVCLWTTYRLLLSRHLFCVAVPWHCAIAYALCRITRAPGRVCIASSRVRVGFHTVAHIVRCIHLPRRALRGHQQHIALLRICLSFCTALRVAHRSRAVALDAGIFAARARRVLLRWLVWLLGVASFVWMYQAIVCLDHAFLLHHPPRFNLDTAFYARYRCHNVACANDRLPACAEHHFVFGAFILKMFLRFAPRRTPVAFCLLRYRILPARIAIDIAASLLHAPLQRERRRAQRMLPLYACVRCTC